MADDAPQVPKKAIPKFASFKPKEAEVNDDQITRTGHRRSKEHRSSKSKGEESTRRHHPDRSRGRHAHTRSRSRERSHRQHDDRRSHRELPARLYRSELASHPTTDRGATPEKESDLFVVDKKGDENNIKYRSLDRYSIPIYRRQGFGRIIGLHNDLVVDRRLEEHGLMTIIHKYRDSSSRYDQRRNDLSHAPRFPDSTDALVIAPVAMSREDGLEEQTDYVSFSTRSSRKRRKLESAKDDDANNGHIQLFGAQAVEQDDSSDSGSSKRSESPEIVSFNLGDSAMAHRELAELSRKVDQKPHDIAAWLALIEAQKLLFKSSPGSYDKKLSGSEIRSLADLRYSLYQKALSNFTIKASRYRLLKGTMEEGQKLWDTKGTMAKWKEILRENPSSHLLWRDYLDFQQTNLLSFTFDGARQVFTDCFTVLMQSPETQENDRIWIYIFLRLTSFIRESGYSELATALWQAILEFNFFRPDSDSLNEAVSAFETFWDDEAPRIGDQRSKGWCNSSEYLDRGVTKDKEFAIDRTRIFESWARAETEQATEGYFTAHTLDDTNEDDPFRVVLFSDVQEYLHFFTAPTSNRVLLEAFLCFCHLPPLPRRPGIESHSWADDPFLRNELVDTQSVEQWFWSQDQLSDAEELEQGAFHTPLHNFPSSNETLFATEIAWSSLAIVEYLYSSTAGPEVLQWICRAVKLLLEANPDDDALAEYAIALDFKRNAKEGRRYAKGLLKNRNFSLRLYNAYALIECRLGSLAGAEHIWSTTMEMSKSTAVETSDSVLIWRSWIWEALRSNDRRTASRLLLSIADGKVDVNTLKQSSAENHGASHTAKLRVQSHLSDLQYKSLADRDIEAFVGISDLLALLAYIEASSVEAACASYSSSWKMLVSRRLDTDNRCELLHQAKALLIAHHITSPQPATYKPSVLALELSQSLDRYPQNTILLTLHHRIQSRILITDRLRMNELRSESRDSIINAFFRIYTESHRLVGGTVASTRAAFEHAISPPSTSSSSLSANSASYASRSCAGLWRLYVEFEVRVYKKELELLESRSQLSKKRSGKSSSSSSSSSTAAVAKKKAAAAQRVKDVFYAGIRAVPWVKGYLMLAFTLLLPAGILDFEECKSVYDILVEKGLRVRVDIQDILEDIQQGRGDSGPLQIPVDRDDEMRGDM